MPAKNTTPEPDVTPETPVVQPETPARTVVVLAGYRGRATNEEYIPEGTYLETDERLFGLAEYLVELGRARWE